MAQQSNDVYAALALSRFGLGADHNGAASIASDPRGALMEEITERFAPVPVGPQLQSTADLLVSLYAFQEQRKEARQQAATAAAAMPQDKPVQGPPRPQQLPGQPSGVMAAQPNNQAMAAVIGKAAEKLEKPQMPYLPQQILLAEVDARFNGTIRQPLIGFGERLAMFWANHFAVAVSKSEEVHIVAGAFEREAIRPHVFGRFADMLLAVETHPAMLGYLDNQQSIGPNSKANANKKRGLNENLARETLELHTLGVNGGYTQTDVTTLAKIITGWTVARAEGKLGAPGTFVFNAGAHEPGDQTLLGLTYADNGVGQGREALRDLARHPATAQHIATKLVRHFVADTPPPALVQTVAATFSKTDGDLSAVYRALIGSEDAWNPTLSKVRSPLEFMTALLRASGETPKPNVILGALTAMGQPFWAPAGPNGFADTADVWASSESLSMRMDVANMIANAVPPQIDPRRFVSDSLGPLLSNETLRAVSRAETRNQGLAIAYLSPEFQRR
ncbi:DUF1800 family protein [Rhizobium sp. P40RR-XXII]|uniref:DUF1800 domain-containing protein n=1 Tax=unclassified Rhizobium TaxID=2613769 RepID=UPI0014567639|nr:MULTISPECIES: DUF1800 family protein [unclassified Rhizobium]NLR85820.1 DUF1800 family protein [Rhizobium sp. P28RR-XV]NLS19400.1 DUF1800 family protein [Rhizobium sp. P40RR-XXII]